jgi:hypothetical protein
MKNTILLKGFIPLLITFFCVQSMFGQTTYTVTSTSKDGPGSIIEAITLANNNPGADIIEFTPGLQVNASYPQFSGSSGDFMLTVTESVIIDGKGGAINGRQKWVSANGDFDNIAKCPGSIPSTIILAQMPNFIDVKSGINVTIKNLSIKQFNSITEIRDNASLILENFQASEIRSTVQCHSKGLFGVSAGATLSIKDSKFLESYNWASPGLGTAIVSVGSAGNLTIDNSLFYSIEAGDQFLISWQGTSSSKVNIVSSRLLGSGGIIIGGSTSTTNIVNSTMVTRDGGSPEYGERIINSSTGSMNINASSIKWNSNKCATICPISSQILIESKNGPINLSESAIGFNYSETTGTLLATLGVSGTGTFTADKNTWIEPTSNQDASALQTITSQPSLIVNTPGFVTQISTQVAFNDVELVSPSISGVLIDVINTALTNPIDGKPITLDVIGNDRFDANGFRDIGAIQLGLAPSLTVTATGDQSVDIAWQKPLHHNGASIVRYEYQYIETSGGSPTVINAGKNLTAKITGLTNGTSYNFSVRGIYDESGSEVNGPFSNIGSGTPYGTLATPTLTATPGDAQVSLSWNQPDLGGRTFQSYVIVWKIDGTTNYIDGAFISDPNQTTKTITNLANETTYEFAFKVKASGDFSSNVFKTATPSATLGLENLDLVDGKFSYYPNPIKNYLHINLDKNTHTKVFSINGSLLIDAKVSKHIDVSSLSSGLYVLQIQVEGKMYSSKILKN